jgi:hypothetical protein
MNYFREHALLDYFAGGFDGPGEGVLLVHGAISRSAGPGFHGTHAARGARLCPAAPGRPETARSEREGYTLLLALRSWEFEAFAGMRR